MNKGIPRIRNQIVEWDITRERTSDTGTVLKGSGAGKSSTNLKERGRIQVCKWSQLTEETGISTGPLGVGRRA